MFGDRFTFDRVPADMEEALERSLLIAEFKQWLSMTSAEDFRTYRFRNDNHPED